MEKVCLDTDVLIQALKGDELIALRLQELSANGLLFTTAYNTFELFEGIYRKKSIQEKERRKVEELFSNIKVLDLSFESSLLAARLFAELIARGRETQRGDAIIAAVCLQNNCKLFTLNKKHFEGITGLELA